MPENITIAAFVLGAVMLLISIVGGKFKIFGAEVSSIAGPTGRILAGVLGTVLICIGLYYSLSISEAMRAEEKTMSPVEPASQTGTKMVSEAVSSKVLPATFVLRELTCIRTQESGGEDRVYLKLGDSHPTQVWKLKAGESIRIDLTIAAGTSINLYEKDGFMADGDDDFLGTAKPLDSDGILQFEIPETGNHFYTLSYESKS